MTKRTFYASAGIAFFLIVFLAFFWPPVTYLLILLALYVGLGISDLNSNHNILRNYPVVGHFRYGLEFLRPEIQQYFIATNQSGRPFNREQRSLVYQRAKKAVDTLPFGTQHDITDAGYQFAMHSLAPKIVTREKTRTWIGREQCQHPYHTSRLNISAMSFGALGENAVMAMNRGAKLGDFAQNTGEGGLSEYHLRHGGDIIWQIGTGYFGCRTPDGHFDPEKFSEKSGQTQVKMIEIKLSQGAKPSHGGILPAAKITHEIATIRGIPMGVDCLSPPAHTAFDSPKGLLNYVAKLRELSGGKPVGFKLCIGYRREFMSLCKAMCETGLIPDFITVDGAEGGTGAAPVEFENSLGMPIDEAIVFVHNCLVGTALRDKICLISSGKVVTGFDLVTKIALGADVCNSARAMMFAVGCIQALRCNTNRCPTGVTTQDKERQKALLVGHKARHVVNYHEATLQSFLELVGAIGVEDPDQLRAEHIWSRLADQTPIKFNERYEYLQSGDLLRASLPKAYKEDWQKARADRF